VYNALTPSRESESIVFSIHCARRAPLLILCAQLSPRAFAQALSDIFVALDLRNGS
jgi:hypothetical protein